MTFYSDLMQRHRSSAEPPKWVDTGACCGRLVRERDVAGADLDDQGKLRT